MKKRILVSLIVLLVVAIATIMASCSVEQSLDYNDSIDSIYGDSFSIVSSSDAPSDAIEYANVPRVTKKIIVDNRITGVHSLGLYIPKGETIKVTIDANQVGKGHKILGNDNMFSSSGVLPFSVNLNDVTTEIERTSNYGGEIELFVSESVSTSFCITIEGAVESSFYRYGIDSKESINSVGEYTVLDATNIRLYFPITYNEKIKDVSNTMLWWRMALVSMDKLFNLSFFNNDNSPLKIYFKDLVLNPSYDVEENKIYLPVSYIEEAVNYDNLISGNNGTILEVLKVIVQEKEEKTQCFENSVLKDSISSIVSSLTYASMVDSYLSLDIDANKILHVENIVKDAIDKTYSDKNVSLFMNIYYGFGEEQTYSCLGASKTCLDLSEVLNEATRILNTDFTSLASAYDISYTVEDNTLNKFYLVSSSLVSGGTLFENQTGLHVEIGETTTFDFNESIVGDGWEVSDLKGTAGLWNKVSDGVYSYTPDSKNLQDNFTLVLKNGDSEVYLKNNITVDIAVCSTVIYEDVSFTSLEDATKHYKDSTPTKSESILYAQVEKEDTIDDTKKSFVVTNGCIEVPKDGYYTIYLKSAGLCSVDFGVKEYYTTILSNILTVPAYTSELSYRVKLQTGYTYYFTIYNLANKGVGYASLGIKMDDWENIEDIGVDYLIYPKLSRSQIVEFSVPQKEVETLTTQGETYNDVVVSSMKINDNEYNFKDSVDGTSNKDTILKVTLNDTSRINYINIDVESMEGVSMYVMYDSGLKYGETITLKNGENIIEGKEIRASLIMFYFRGEKDYKVCVDNIRISYKLEKMSIIPSSSTEIEFIGEWYTDYSYIGINGTLVVSKAEGATFSYSFNGNRVALYAVKGPEFGSATVYIDDKEVETISFYSDKIECAQLVFSKDLSDGDHTIKIISDSETPINFDYIAVSKLGETKNDIDYSKIWYMATIIPGIIIIAGIVFIALDIRAKKLKKKESQQ